MTEQHPCRQFMLQAVDLSRRGFGRVAPNPCVGALIVRDGAVLARGWHDVYGGPHAERMALDDAAQRGVELTGCSMIVTLEPCRHYGKTPPCAEAIVRSGIRHVVIGARDPNPAAAGGADLLREAGLAVEVGVAERECLDNIRDFLHFKSGSKLPYLILKMASTLDGRIATRTGQAQWVSARESLAFTHWLRTRVQAVMVGGATFNQDNPRLNARTDVLGREPEAQPLAVALCPRLPEDYLRFDLLRERPEDTIFFTTPAEATGEKAAALRGRGVVVHGVSGGPHGLDLPEVLKVLWQQHGCRHVMCEGGGRLGLALLQNGLVGELLLFMAPKILGDNQARPLFDGMAPEHMDQALGLRVAGVRPSGDDLCIRFLPAVNDECGV